MALIIETGSVVVGAESYATAAELRAYAQKRGATVPADDPSCEVLLVKACDYLQAQEPRFKGRRVKIDQTLAWPRWGVEVGGYVLRYDTIPPDLKAAQMQAAIEAQTVDLMPTVDPSTQTGPVIEETIDVLTTKYAEPTARREAPLLARVNGLLDQFCVGGSGQIRLVRA